MSGFKKVENFRKRHEDFLEWKEVPCPGFFPMNLEEKEKNPSLPSWQTANPEDVEMDLVSREMDREMWEDFKRVERIIAMREGEDGSIEYLVKWYSSSYDMCTWETPDGEGGAKQG